MADQDYGQGGDQYTYEASDTVGTSRSSSQKGKKARAAASAFGSSMSQRGQDMIADAGRSASEGAQAENDRSKAQADRELERAANAPSYHRGGTVRKTGLARLQKGERVVPRNKVRKLKRIKSGRMM